MIGVLDANMEVLFPPNVPVERLPEVYTAPRFDFVNASRANVSLRVVARLKDGVSLEQAQAQADQVAADLRRRFPVKETAGLQFRVEPMHGGLVADVRPSILALMGAVVFVLLVACANVANLLLVRAGAREREFAIRAALGGSRFRLVRQVLVESLAVALAGAVLGLALADVGVQLLVRSARPTCRGSTPSRSTGSSLCSPAPRPSRPQSSSAWSRRCEPRVRHAGGAALERPRDARRPLAMAARRASSWPKSPCPSSCWSAAA